MGLSLRSDPAQMTSGGAPINRHSQCPLACFRGTKSGSSRFVRRCAKELTLQVERSEPRPIEDCDFALVLAYEIENAGAAHPRQRTRDSFKRQAEIVGN